jgi:hypothetical protein
MAGEFDDLPFPGRELGEVDFCDLDTTLSFPGRTRRSIGQPRNEPMGT